MLIGLLVIVGVLTGLVCVAYAYRSTWAILSILTVMALAACGGQGIWMLPILIGLGVTAAICRACKFKTGGFALTCAGLTAAAAGIAALLFIPVHREHRKLLEENPYVDVQERLGYENRGEALGRADGSPAANRDGEQEATEPVGPESLREILHAEDAKDLDRGLRSRFREQSLASLARTHAGFVADFVDAEGFGVIRMVRIPVDRKHIELPDPPPLTLPEPVPSPPQSADGSDPRPVAAAEPAAIDARASRPDVILLSRMHRDGIVDFVNPEGFGYVKSRKEVLGFQSHGFREIPAIAARAGETSKWQIVSLELVSLLKHDPPAAYVSRHLPRMAELIDAPTRPLDPFESTALAKLRAGGELVVDSTAEEIRMLGPLRAYKECRQCHQVEDRALLGAFTYRLRPSDVPPPRVARPTPPAL